MNQEKKTQQSQSVWVDATERIVSFKYVEGLEQLNFPSHDEMIVFVIEKGATGYRIQ